MWKNKNKFILILAILFVSSLNPVKANNIKIPGSTSHICYYTHFFYNFPNRDFIYYLNDRLIFTKVSEMTKTKKNLRRKIDRIIIQHQKIKKFIRAISKKNTNIITLNLTNKNDFQQAVQLLELLGLELKFNKRDQYNVKRKIARDAVDYYNFALLRPRTLTI